MSVGGVSVVAGSEACVGGAAGSEAARSEACVGGVAGNKHGSHITKDIHP